MKKNIAIIGGGASGTLLAVNLLIHGSSDLNLHLIEKKDHLARGVAYGTSEDVHLLNVPAAKMGAFPDDVGHFHTWLGKNGYDHAGDAFVPRKIYARYLRSLLNDAATCETGAKLILHDAEAIDLDLSENGGTIHLSTGKTVDAEKIVLAFGNSLPPHPSVADNGYTSADKYFRDPWRSAVYDSIAPDDRILIIGTGLSMVDVALRYHLAGHRGLITAISTRGLLPAIHKLGFTYPDFYDEIKGMERVTDVMRIVRRHVKRANANGSDWRAVIDSLRPHTQQIWLDLPLAEKSYFKQHLSRYWNVARHRMPPYAAESIQKMKQAGKLEILAGRLDTIDFADGVFTVKYTDKGSEYLIDADAIVNCIGSEADFAKHQTSLTTNILSHGFARCDALRMGLDAAPNGTIIDSSGRESRTLFTLGTALKGILWESTAMPEIRQQARSLASKLLSGD